MNDKENGVGNAQIMHSIGQLTGTVQAMHQGMTARIEDIRIDIRRMEESTNDRINRVEDNLSNHISEQGTAINMRIDGLENNVNDKFKSLGTRVTALEAEDKRIIEKVASIGALGGGLSGALAAGLVELIKHF